jgi:nitroreductase
MQTSQFKNLSKQFLQRRSSRGFEKVKISKTDIETMIEAARFAPSCYNDQPWQFYVLENSDDSSKFLQLLVPVNQTWAANASAIVFLGARKHFGHNGNENPWSKFDAGAAWMSFALQAENLGYSAHAMAGILFDQAYRVLGVDANKVELLCAIAIGKDTEVDSKPSNRKSLSEIVSYVPTNN